MILNVFQTPFSNSWPERASDFRIQVIANGSKWSFGKTRFPNDLQMARLKTKRRLSVHSLLGREIEWPIWFVSSSGEEFAARLGLDFKFGGLRKSPSEGRI